MGRKRPLREVLREVVLPTDAPLYRDPEHLVREEDEIRTAGPYFGVLQAISDGLTTPTEIGGRLQVDSQLVNAYLARLRRLGYVEKVAPIAPGGKGNARAYWRIKDPYFRFWFRFVFPNRSRLERGRISEVAAEIERGLPDFTAFVFEDVCRDWVGRISPLGASADAVGSWWSRKSDLEVDVAAVDERGYTLLGSCKWWKSEAGENVLEELLGARSAIGPKANQAQLAIFAKSGFSDSLRRRAAHERVELVSVVDLFR